MLRGNVRVTLHLREIDLEEMPSRGGWSPNPPMDTVAGGGRCSGEGGRAAAAVWSWGRSGVEEGVE